MRHRTVRRLLDEHLGGTLSPEKAREVDLHLSRCPFCAAERAALRRTQEALRPSHPSPAECRPPEFWERFPEEVERRILARQHRRGSVRELADAAAAAVTAYPRTFLALGAAALAAGILLGPGKDSPTGSPASPTPGMVRYLARSRALLVGLSNTPPGGEPRPDLSLERAVSRDLLSEGAHLRRLVSEERSARLLEDIEHLLREIDESPSRPPGEVLRTLHGSMQRGNLLFRIRAEEAARDTQTSPQPFLEESL
ncbi:MAG: zf-HC2 domain-containing protein [Bacteroidota bacterium]